MFKVDGLVHLVCTWIYRFAYLNLLFLVSCLPIITIFPATVSLFGVVRQWIKKNDPPVFTTYKLLFVENFKQSMIIGPAITGLFLLIFADFYLISRMQIGMKDILFITLVIISFFLFISVLYISPLMVNGYYSSKQLVKSSFQFAIYKPLLTITNALALIGFVIIALRFSFFLVFFFFSISAFITYWFSEKKFIHATLTEK
ncbi:YesL family protein [Neobacillus driksii]|uniref:YesL family protein n=1 Tax=Neobacillus driksii TaxID=3035913 RepID=UPI0035BC4E1E